MQTSQNNKINVYTCEKCAGQVVTIDTEPGVTPFSLICRAKKDCGGRMHSAFYQVSQELNPEYQWRKPTKTEFYQLDEATREYVTKGGLLIYPLNSITRKEVKASRRQGKTRILNRRLARKVAVKQAKRSSGRRLTANELAML